MKVYVTVTDDANIDRVFRNEEDAIDYVTSLQCEGIDAYAVVRELE